MSTTDNSTANDFSFPERQTFPFSIGDKKFLIREAGGFASKRYQQLQLGSAKKIKGGEAEEFDVEKLISKDYQLLADCCYCVKEDGSMGAPVTLDQIMAWPDRAIQKLITKLKEMSDIGQVTDADSIRKQIAALQKLLAKIENKETPEDLAKNVQSSGGITSSTAQASE